ncbi:MAG TPA: YsnF/AvaK domain-containing protein [Caldimonas sp.]|jgi:uncharacterized protein (TIGR02271 family)|nr:YsnF/AvaK domain-containing protein [Caldimonas sp.]HEX2540145.1 YsnF/AvaK domain-containing protein [Caldimonas sp.]
MENVLLAVFDSQQGAQAARARLLEAGFAEAAVALTGRGAHDTSAERSGVTVRVTSEAELNRAEQVLEAAGAETLPVLEEQLEVGRRTERSGVVRVSSRVVEAPVEQAVHLREERATVERRAADRPAGEADLAAFAEGVLDVREMVEVAVVSKTARVIEEVEISKRIVHHEEVVRDTVRRTEVHVDRMPATAREPETHR